MPANAEIHLQDRKVVVTGGARGLGESFARAAVSAGAFVCITDILHERGQQLAFELAASFPGRANYVPMDLLEQASVDNGMAHAASLMGGIDGLVNNAALTNSGGKDFTDISTETWDQVMDVNVRGTWWATCAATPYLRASGSGRIVNIASDTVLWGAPRLLAYVASKGAVIAMTHSLARELGAAGITVNAVAPGLTEVEATQYVPAARHDQYREGRAIQRAQLPADVNAAVLFLLTRASGFVTGQLLPVNGGFVMN